MCSASVASDVTESIIMVQEEERPRFWRLLNFGHLTERYDDLQETASAPILVGKCDRNRWVQRKVQMSGSAVQKTLVTKQMTQVVESCSPISRIDG